MTSSGVEQEELTGSEMRKCLDTRLNDVLLWLLPKTSDIIFWCYQLAITSRGRKLTTQKWQQKQFYALGKRQNGQRTEPASVRSITINKFLLTLSGLIHRDKESSKSLKCVKDDSTRELRLLIVSLMKWKLLPWSWHLFGAKVSR